MGFMTEIGILNDHWHRIKEDPEGFVAFINETMHSGSERGRGFYQTRVHASHHADDARLYFSEGNWFTSLNEYEIEEELRARIGETDDWVLDLYLSRIESARRMLDGAEQYVSYLKEVVPSEERPGGQEYVRYGNQHHNRAWKWWRRRKKKA